MAINRVEIKDFLVFKGEFIANFCSGVNVLIGGNGTGKTTLLKCLYDLKPSVIPVSPGGGALQSGGFHLYVRDNIRTGKHDFKWGIVNIDDKLNNFVYIPEKDILEHAKGLLTFIMQKQTGFSEIYKDVLITAQDIPTNNQTTTQKEVGQRISDAIGGEVHWDKGDGSFYTLRTDGTRIPFVNEASGYKKLGFLGLLVTSGQLEKGSILFWDEPENSLNPELIPVLVDILLELSRNGVQIFIATHSEVLASYFSVNKQRSDIVMFHSLYKDGEQVKINSNDRFDLLVPNKLTEEPVNLYEKELDRGLGNE